MKRRVLFCFCAVLMLILFTACGAKKNSSSAETNLPQKQEQISYTEQEKARFYQEMDALLLAAAACQADPGSGSCSLIENAEGLSLSMTVNAIPVSFDLQTPGMVINSTADGGAQSFTYTSKRYDAVDGTVMLKDYEKHLVGLGATVVASFEKDLDEDGVIEHLFVTENLVEQWLNMPLEAKKVSTLLENMRLCLLVDSDHAGGMVCHGVVLPEYVTEIRDVRWDNGMVHFLYGQNQLYRLFAGECAVSLNDYRDQEEILRRICVRYVTYLEDQGYTDVHIRLADVSAAPGWEVLCCYSDGTNYTAVVLAAYCGRLQPLYSCHGSYGALFVVDYENSQFLLEYTQRLGADYSQSYGYQLFRFDNSFDIQVNEEAAIQIAVNQGGGTEGTRFFEKIKQYLKNAQVCYDPYVLTGYEVMQEQTQQMPIRPEEKYLRITNCSTNKIGTVKIQDANSWLNFRTGPSTDSEMVLIDPANPKSFVKQVFGAPMTVILPHNTNDPVNPIWVYIRISYYGQTLEGYSSQQYVDIEGIKHVSVGDSFTVTAETNDIGLQWSSSDTTVAAVDPQTGTLTAIRKGLVLITVTSASGLEDSCLIMID